MVVREQTLITLTVEEVRLKLPFPMLGLDVDNDSAFINETVVDYCKDRKLELTRSRAYKKNDQAWIEQKNGSVVRLYVNFFQPSFKLKSKIREGAKVKKKYYLPATPYERLLANDRVTTECKEQLRHTFSTLDPVQLLNQIRECQRNLVRQEVGSGSEKGTETSQNLNQFIENLATAWHDGEIRPTHRKQSTGPRTWRTRVDPFESVWPVVEQWLDEPRCQRERNLSSASD